MNETDKNKLENHINTRMELKEKIDNLTELKKEVEEKIKIIMEQNMLDNYEDKKGNYATYKEITTNRLNKALVEERLAPQQFKECFKESTSVRLTIISPQEKERRKNFKG